MVALKTLFLLGAALASAVPAPAPLNGEKGINLAARNEDAPLAANAAPGNTAPLERRRPGRMQMHYSATGRIMFLLGMPLSNVPTDILATFQDLGEPAPARALLDNFIGFLNTQFDQGHYTSAWIAVVNHHPLQGGIYGKTVGVIQDIFGFAIQLDPAAANDNGIFANVLAALHDWASQGGALVQEIQELNNDFCPLESIGALGPGQKEKRARGNACPAKNDLLQYAIEDVPPYDPGRDLGWGGPCGGP